jgi:RNA polymerase sigma-70 factor (ECF subfamily)
VRAQVRAAIEQPPPSHRAIIALRDFEDLTTEEAATTLGISANAAKIRLHRARQALATLLRRVEP